MNQKPGEGASTLLSTRRTFLKRSSGLAFCLALGGLTTRATNVRADPDVAASTGHYFNAYVTISPSGIVTIRYPSAEMGQGVMTSLPIILAEEMDADWEKVRVEPSPPVGKVYGDPLFLDMIFTVDSRAVPTYYDRLRIFGAQARKVLLMSAANYLQVPLSELHTQPGVVVHDHSGRRLDFGKIAEFAQVPEKPPTVASSELKHPSDFRLIGHDVEPFELASKTDGTTQFSIDAAPPDLIYATVRRSPIIGATLKSVEDAAAASSPGVIRIVQRKEAVAVVARTFYQALQAKRKLRIEWNRVGKVNDYDSDSAIKTNMRIARDLSTRGVPWDQAGNLKPALSSAHKIFERQYCSDYMYHAGLEPMNATVRLKENGRTAEVWAGTQAPKYTLDKVAEKTGVHPSNVVLHRTLLGGAFGRRSIYSMDFVEDAAWLSKEMHKPVKVIWDREEDIKHGYFRPLTAQYLRAGLDRHGRITAWHHRVACEDPIKKAEPLLWKAWDHLPLIAMDGSGYRNDNGTPLSFAYDLPTRLVEYLAVETGIRIYAMRGVGSVPNRFAIESFLDEIAADGGKDPLEFRLGLLQRSKRAQHVLHAVAEMSSWGKSRPSSALGLCYSYHAHSPLACVVEISVERSTGKIRTHNVWIAIDVGIAIQPNNLRAQLEGGAIYGLSNALSERITIKNGLVQQTNFSDYQIMRMPDAPKVHVKIVNSGVSPTGVGETGTVVTPAAMANAFTALTGRRVRHLPLTTKRVKEVLG